MKQFNAIDKITEALKKDDAIKAIFLKGSIAKECIDDYSDVDFYCVVEHEKLDEFLNRRLYYLKQYKPLLYWSESDFVGPQIVAVFEDGLHFDLYTVTSETLQSTGEIKVIYDPLDLLKNYQPVPLKLNDSDVIEFFHEFTFSLLEFEAAYYRKDLLWASRLASHLSGDLAMLLRFLYDENNSKLGFKRLFNHIDNNLHSKMLNAMDLSGPTFLPKGVKLLVEIADEVLETLPKRISKEINTDFFEFMANKIDKI